MDKKWILIISFVVIMLAVVWYFYGREDENIIIENNDASDQIHCLDEMNEPAWPDNPRAINWGLVWWNVFEGVSANKAMELGNSKGMGWLKGHNLFPNERVITLYKDNIIKYAKRSNALLHQDVMVGEFLCA